MKTRPKANEPTESTQRKRRPYKRPERKNTWPPTTEQWINTKGRRHLREFCKLIAWAKTHQEGRKINVEEMLKYYAREMGQ